MAVGNTESTGRITGSCRGRTIGFDAVGNRAILSDGGLNAALDRAVGERGVLNDDGTTHFVIVIGHIVTDGALGSQLEAFARDVGKLDIAGKVDNLGAVQIDSCLSFIELEVAATVNHGTGQVRAVDEGDVSRSAIEVGIRHGSTVNRDSTTNFSIHIVNYGTILNSEVTTSFNDDVALIVINNGGVSGKSQVTSGRNLGTVINGNVVEADVTLTCSRGAGDDFAVDTVAAVVEDDVTICGFDAAINSGNGVLYVSALVESVGVDCYLYVVAVGNAERGAYGCGC